MIIPQHVENNFTVRASCNRIHYFEKAINISMIILKAFINGSVKGSTLVKVHMLK